MHRLGGLVIALVLVGCAAKKAGAPHDEGSPMLPPPAPPGGGEAPHSPVAETNSPKADIRPDPATVATPAKTEARADGVLGATDSRFDDSPIDGNRKGEQQHAKTSGSAGGEAGAAVAVKATLDKKQSDELTTLVKGHLDDIGACRTHAAGATGHLDVTFTVGDKGTIEKVTIASTSTVKDTAVSECVTSVIKKLSLAPTTKAKRGTITLTL